MLANRIPSLITSILPWPDRPLVRWLLVFLAPILLGAAVILAVIERV